jgi:hypothetical protein
MFSVKGFVRAVLLVVLPWVMLPGSPWAQMIMAPYFTAINYPLEKHSLMLIARLASFGLEAAE